MLFLILILCIINFVNSKYTNKEEFANDGSLIHKEWEDNLRKVIFVITFHPHTL